MRSPKPWWETDTYNDERPLPLAISAAAGSQGVALVRAWPDGRTDPGWGLQPPKNSMVTGDGFMLRYTQDAFNPRPVLYGYKKGKWAFAIIMRSVKLVCVDIDGKNGGLEHVKKLGALPPTLAETSKSGNGYHLFYSFEEEWDEEEGFGLIHDRIGIEQGVDIRSTGCVYHYDPQRWNGSKVTPLPDYLRDLLLTKQRDRAHRAAAIASVLDSDDETEILLMQHELTKDLAKPIPAGKRNNTLFAIGQQMKTAQVPNWEALIEKRADEVGLSDEEIEKLVSNITRYQ